MIDSVLFIGAIIIAVTQVIKTVWPQVTGVFTIIVAVVVGAVVASVDTSIGVTDISIAEGILTGLAAVGVHTVASSINSK